MSSINLKLVSSLSEINDQSLIFHPLYTHQLFENEEIKGIQDVSLDLFFTGASMVPYMALKYEKVFEDATPIREILTKLMPQQKTPTENLFEFSKAIEEEETFTPLGSCIASYRLAFSPDSEFLVYHGSIHDPGIREFHEKMQIFVLFYIDGASYIDADDPARHLYFLLNFFELNFLEFTNNF